jgi:two-component system NtrC family sensor kinase
MARIFAPGFTTKSHGSGLGLAVANRVVVAHHGRILIDSEWARGTTITVVLPSDLGGFSSLATQVSRAEP